MGLNIGRLAAFYLADVHLPNGASPIPLICTTWAILDSLYLAQYPIHTSETLVTLKMTISTVIIIFLIFLGFGVTLTFPSFIFLSTTLKQLNFLEQPIIIIQRQVNGFILTMQRMLTRWPITKTSLFRWQNGLSIKKRLCITIIFSLGDANSTHLWQRQMLVLPSPQAHAAHHFLIGRLQIWHAC